MLPFAGGTWVFFGPGVSGGYFHPTTLGPHTITLCYTDPYGCMSCITKTINVINCVVCNPPCQISAGPDKHICAGGVAILSVQGCNATPTWYILGNENNNQSPFAIGQGQILDVTPQQTTCYMVICCCSPSCCDTDTVCVIVHPIPVLQWPVSYAKVCLNAAPIVLSLSNIYVYVNFAWVPVSIAGGTGYFSGPGVFGNSFYPSTLGAHFITYTYTDAYGCTGTVTNMIVVKKCKVKLHIKLFIEGFYIRRDSMLAIADPVHFPTVCDTITVELHEDIPPYGLVYSISGVIDIHGHGNFEFPENAQDNHYYIVVKHRNSLETWSKNPVWLDQVELDFDFTMH